MYGLAAGRGPESEARPPALGDHVLLRDQNQALIGLVALFCITAAWWALALWPVSDAPAWLERTRYVCFGARGNGLPDAGGWIGLIAGPGGMLAILLVGWRSGMTALLRRARTSHAVAATLATLALVGVVLVTCAAVRVLQARSVWLDTGAARAGNPNESLAVARPAAEHPRLDRVAPRLVLTSQHGTTIDLAALRGRTVLVAFAYAHCTTICPLIVQHVLRAQEELRGGGQEPTRTAGSPPTRAAGSPQPPRSAGSPPTRTAGSPQPRASHADPIAGRHPASPAVLIVTVDPWRDTPTSLPSLATRWRLPAEGAWVLSGAVNDVETVLDDWQVARRRDITTGEITHPSLVYVVDREGRLAFVSTGGTDVLVSLVRRLE